MDEMKSREKAWNDTMELLRKWDKDKLDVPAALSASLTVLISCLLNVSESERTVWSVIKECVKGATDFEKAVEISKGMGKL